MERDEIQERGGGLFAPDTLLAGQYFDRIRRRKDLSGEQRLMCAIIEDGVEAFLKHAAATQRHHQESFEDAERWIESEDRTWIYSFDTICDYLGLETDYLRRGLRAFKARARGQQPAAAARVEVGETPEPTVDQRRAG